MSESEFEDQMESYKPRVIVEFTQLEKLLQRCPDCGKLPGGPKTGKPRSINWTKNGTNMTAVFTCVCKNRQRIRWSGTRIHTRNRDQVIFPAE